MTSVAGRKVKGYSLGMRQRLGLAGVLLGDPHTVILDEPANGLDPEGVRWIRDVLVALAGEGRTVLVSSHLLSEISLMADDLVVIGRGQLIEQGPVEQFIDRYAQRWVRVRTPRPAEFAEVLHRAGGQIRPHGRDGVDVQGLPIERVGELALQTQTLLFELSPQSESLEDAFLSATAGAQEYRSVASRSHRRRRSAARPPASPSSGVRTARRWAMTEAIRSEWIKLSTLTVNKVLVIIAVAFPIVVTALVAGLTSDAFDSGDIADLIGGLAWLSVLLLGVVCTIGMSGEFGYNTIRPTFAAQPQRLRPLLAKLAVQLVTIAVLMAAIVAVGWVIATNVLDGMFSLTDEPRFDGPGSASALTGLAGTVAFAVGVGIAGFGLGNLIRNTPAAVTALLLWPLVLENILARLLFAAIDKEWARYMPFTQGLTLTVSDRGDDSAETLSRLPAGLYFFAVAIVIAILGVVRTQQSDAYGLACRPRRQCGVRHLRVARRRRSDEVEPLSAGAELEAVALGDRVLAVALLEPAEADEAGDRLVHPFPRCADHSGELLLGDGQHEVIAAVGELEEPFGGAPGDIEEHRVGDRFVHRAQALGEQAGDVPEHRRLLVEHGDHRLVRHGKDPRRLERPRQR